jgi:threonine aldolase
MEINLISDTVTKPTNVAVYMFNAEVGDDVYRQDQQL